jgi:DNA-binding Lrp family transcriptional regulator
MSTSKDGRPSPPIDRLDRQLLHALQIDGRAPFRRLASVLGASEQTVARRYRRLWDIRGRGALPRRLLVAAEPLGFATTARLYLAVAPGAR